MCLERVIETFNPPTLDIQEGYKVFSLRSNHRRAALEVTFPFCYITQNDEKTRAVPFDTWLKAAVDPYTFSFIGPGEIVHGEVDRRPYKVGFHIYPHKESADGVKEHIGPSVVLKVTYTGVVARGFQKHHDLKAKMDMNDLVVVAREMYVPQPPPGVLK